MLKFSKKLDYTVGIITEMAREQELFRSSLQLAETLNIPKVLTANLLKFLCQQGIVSSVRGAYGGYRLTKTLDEISLFDLVELIDGPVCLTDCTANNCIRQERCINTHGFAVLNRRFRDLLDMSLTEFLALPEEERSSE
jgi:Rrf2 family protein